MVRSRIPLKRTPATYLEIFNYPSKPKITRRECPVCARPVTQVMHNLADRFGFPISVVTCKCGMTYLLDVMTREGYAEFYGGTSSPYRRLVWTMMHPLGAEYDAPSDKAHLFSSQRYYGQKLRTWEPLRLAMERVTRVLDAGGSTGTVAQILAPQAVITTLDPSPSELEARPEGIIAIQGFLEDAIRTYERFDGILFCETIDHVTDPVTALLNVREVTEPDGIMYIDYVIRTGFKVDHPNYFDEFSMRTLLLKTGWDVIERHGGQQHAGFLCRKS